MNRREILFRGKRVDGKGWVEGFLFWMADIAYILPIGSVTPLQNISAIPSTVGQLHNALTRKAGTNVFVGDIIRHDLEAGLGQPKRIGETSTVNSVEFDYAYYTNVRVVGTIHDTHLTK